MEPNIGISPANAAGTDIQRRNILFRFNYYLFLKGEKQYWTLHPDKTIVTVSTAKTNIYLLYICHTVWLLEQRKISKCRSVCNRYLHGGEWNNRKNVHHGISQKTIYDRPTVYYLIGSYYIYFELWKKSWRFSFRLPFIFTYSPTFSYCKGVF